MSGLHEFRLYWRSLAAAGLGMAAGTGLTLSTASLFAPSLIAEFGWEKSQFALLGTLGFAQIFVTPFIGWLTDLFGVRRIAVIGIISLPLCKFLCSIMDGSIGIYFLLIFIQMTVGTTNSAVVYSRLVSLNFKEARGLALSIMASGGALLLGVGVPLLGGLIETEGWRAGYLAVAIFSAFTGMIVLIVMPRDERMRETDENKGAPPPPRARINRSDYALFLRTRTFWAIAGALCLCNATHILTTSQFMLLLLDQGISPSEAAWCISLYATAIIAGRFLCGYSVDHFPPQIVATIGLGLPTIGLLLLASSLNTLPFVMASVLLMALAQGAEIDLLGYMVARHFEGRIYGSVISLIHSGMTLTSTLGALLLSITFYFTDHFTPFLYVMSFVTAVGASLFLFLKPGQVQIGARPADRASTFEAIPDPAQN